MSVEDLVDASALKALLLISDRADIVGWSQECTILWSRSEASARMVGAHGLFIKQELTAAISEAETARVVTRTLTLCRGDDTTILAHCSVRAYPIPEGFLFGFAIQADICGGEEQHTTTEDFPYSQIIGGLPGMFFMTDPGASLLRWNRRVPAAFQIDERSMQGINVLEFFDNNDRPLVKERMFEAFDRGSSSFEAMVVGALGKRTPCLFLCNATTIDRKRLLFGIAVDISESKRQQARLLIVERAMDACVSAIIITRRDGDKSPIHYVNSAFTAMTGYSADECLGRDPAFMRADDGDSHEHARIRRALADNVHVHALVRNVHKSGALFWNDLRISPVANADGQITHAVAVIEDVTEALRAQEQLRHLATHDQLTGLPNRSVLNDALKGSIERCRRDGGVLALAYIDLDNFKSINDSLGHEAGDQLLTATAARLREAVRSGDTLVRLGGDEFVAILSGCKTVDQVGEVISRLHSLLTAEIVIRATQILPMASVGVSLFPDDGNDAGAILRNADVAMYQAKSAGKNNCKFYAEDMSLSTQHSLERESHLRVAIEKGELFLHFQPKVDLRTNTVVGAEVLVRWNHPTDGILMPNDFISLAEESGSIIALDRWVLDRACASLQVIRDAGFSNFTLSINLSARQLRHPDFLKRVQSVLTQYEVPDGTLEFELTESHLIENPEQAACTMRGLKAMGVRLSIDYLTAGFSSLSHLQRLRMDYIKIDRAILASLDHSGNAIIAEAIIALGHHLNMCVIAEGVETLAQLNFLRDHHCDLMQGHYFSAALSQLALIDLLRADVKLPLPNAVR